MFINSPRALSLVKLIMEICVNMIIYFIASGIVVVIEIIEIMEGTDLFDGSNIGIGKLKKKVKSFYYSIDVMGFGQRLLSRRSTTSYNNSIKKKFAPYLVHTMSCTDRAYCGFVSGVKTRLKLHNVSGRLLTKFIRTILISTTFDALFK